MIPTKTITPSGYEATSIKIISHKIIHGENKVLVTIGAFKDDTIEPKEENALLIKTHEFYNDDFSEETLSSLMNAINGLYKKIGTLGENFFI